MNRVRFCRRLAIFPEQGRGWSEYTGRQWLCPKDNGGSVVVYDGNGNRRLVFEQMGFTGPDGENHTAYDGMILESATSDRNVSSGFGDTGSDNSKNGVPFAKYFKGIMLPDRSLLRIEELRLTTMKTSNADVDATYSVAATPTPMDFFEIRGAAGYNTYAECQGITDGDDVTFNVFSMVSDYIALRLTGLFGATGTFSRSPKMTGLLAFLTSMPRTAASKTTSVADLQNELAQNIATWISFASAVGDNPINLANGLPILQRPAGGSDAVLAPSTNPVTINRTYYVPTNKSVGIYLNHPEIPAGTSFNVAFLLSAVGGYSLGAQVFTTLLGVSGSTILYSVPATVNVNSCKLLVYSVPAQAGPVSENSIMLEIASPYTDTTLIEFRGYYYPHGVSPALNGASLAPYITDINKGSVAPLYAQENFGKMFIPSV